MWCSLSALEMAFSFSFSFVRTCLLAPKCADWLFISAKLEPHLSRCDASDFALLWQVEPFRGGSEEQSLHVQVHSTTWTNRSAAYIPFLLGMLSMLSSILLRLETGLAGFVVGCPAFQDISSLSKSFIELRGCRALARMVLDPSCTASDILGALAV